MAMNATLPRRSRRALQIALRSRLRCSSRFRPTPPTAPIRRLQPAAQPEGATRRGQDRRREAVRCDRQGRDARGARRTQRRDARRRARGHRRRHRRQRARPDDRLPDRRSRRRQDHRRKGRTLPAQVVGYDHASGFGLVRTAVPLDAQPVALGDSARIAERDPVMIASAGGDRCRVRMDRVEAAVHRQLGIPARLGALHEPADCELERRGAHRPRRQAARRSAR